MMRSSLESIKRRAAPDEFFLFSFFFVRRSFYSIAHFAKTGLMIAAANRFAQHPEQRAASVAV
jgi:hypothetical protein